MIYNTKMAVAIFLFSLDVFFFCSSFSCYIFFSFITHYISNRTVILFLFDYCYYNKQFPSESDYVYLLCSFFFFFVIFFLLLLRLWKTGNLTVVINY